MCTRNQLSNIYQQMVEIYRSIYGKAVTGVFLYGSYARGNNCEDSDIDIAAIVKGDCLLLQDKLRTVWDLSADIGLEHDAVVKYLSEQVLSKTMESMDKAVENYKIGLVS